MTHRAPRETGRPRATGHPLGIPAIPLSQAEHDMFRIGLRIGLEAPEVAARGPYDFTELSAHMTSSERRRVSASELTHCVQWLHVGIMYAVLCAAVRDLRDR